VCLVILGGVVLLAQAAYVWGLDHPRRGRWKSWTAAALEGLGLAMLAMSIWFPLSVQRTLILLALGTCLSGGVLLGYTVLHARRHPEQDDFDAYDEEDLEEEGL